MTFEVWLSTNYFFSGRSYYKCNSVYNTPFTLEELKEKFKQHESIRN